MARVLSILLAALVPVWSFPLAAQSPSTGNEAVRVGDGWVYDRKDEITGNPTDTFTSQVTEVTPQEIVTRAIFRGKNGSAFVVFDHGWNRTIDNNVKYNPNDGHGVHLPLAVGKEWRFEYMAQNTQSGANMKATSLAKVVAQETITTDAGTFDAFKIDRQVRGFNTADPSKLLEMEILMWFSPQINHWVRRTITTKFEKRVRASSTDELIDIIHKL